MRSPCEAWDLRSTKKTFADSKRIDLTDIGRQID